MSQTYKINHKSNKEVITTYPYVSAGQICDVNDTILKQPGNELIKCNITYSITIDLY